MGINEFRKNRRERLLAWIEWGYADECHERWTNADMLWAYNYGLKHGIKKKIIPIRTNRRLKATKGYKKAKKAIEQLKRYSP